MSTEATAGEVLLRCELCGATIPTGRSVCMICGNRKAETVKPVDAADLTSLRDFSAAMLIVVIAALLLLLIYIPTLHPIASPGGRMVRILMITSIAVAALGMKDAAELTRVGLALDPVKQFLYLLVAWPITMPLYFVERRKLGLADRTKRAWAVSAAAIFAIIGLTIFIRMKDEKFRPAVLNKPAKEVRTHWPGGHQM